MAATMTSCAKLNVKSVYQILKQCHRTASHSQVQKHACQFDLVLNSHHVLRSPHFTYCRRFYCQKQNAETGDITASILQSRIGAEQNRQNTDTTSKDQKSEEQPKKEKKGFTMFGRFISWQSAGMGSFFIMMSGTLTLMVASWGNYALV
ncbi:hypothetical protein DPMN_094473 [Dreissena polymorpha]|uniref:Uncharacterized protein n=1 Tax=Dreissena polymorpha TaxID=45954 RepID=A0A9D4R1Z6_DREPO|nr:hypothetical protein DPMN_094473 [Dreissena polymorpha]